MRAVERRVVDSRNDMSGSVTGPLIQARDVAFTEPAPVALAGLPPMDLFAGRAAALDVLAQSLRPSPDPAAAPPVVLSVVTGLAGVGKTTLAVRRRMTRSRRAGSPAVCCSSTCRATTSGPG